VCWPAPPAKRNSEHFVNENAVSSIERLAGASWWQTNNESVHLARRTEDCLQHLNLILRDANLLMFIDPHLDPRRDGYGEFIQLKKTYPAVMPCIKGSVELILEQRAESIVYDFQTHPSHRGKIFLLPR
jgi:hypothetical protein